MASSSTVDSELQAAPIAGRPVRGATFASLSVPGYSRIWLSGFLWNLTRWLAIFVCSYLVNRLTGSPFLVQAVGSCFFAPMFLGGAIGGVVSDRFDRQRTILVQLVLLAPLALLMGGLVLAGNMRAWMIYPFMLAVGVGGVLDMTSRRALVYDFVGERFVTNAMALEAMAAMSGSLVGSLTGGVVISTLGVGAAFIAIALAYGVAFALLASVPIESRAHVHGPSYSFRRELTAGLRYLRGQRTLISLLGITVIMNLAFWSYIPLVPVIADRLHVGALWAGVLASGQGIGALIGTLVLAAGLPWKRGRVYVLASTGALAFLLVFGASAWYPLSFLALILAGACLGGFASMQSVLVLDSTQPDMRGRAMGLLSMAIGALPFGLLAVGGLAQLIGPQAAVVVSAATGLAMMAVWSRGSPQAQRLS